jgi:hypothetical protein
MNEEGLSGRIVGTSFGGIILVIVVSVSVGNLPHRGRLPTLTSVIDRQQQQTPQLQAARYLQLICLQSYQ